MQKEIKKKSPIPYYLAGGCWLVYSLCFPFYRMRDIFAAALISALAYWIGGMVFRPVRYTVEVEETFASTGDRQADDMITQGQALLQDIRRANDRIAHPELSNQISSLEEMCLQIFKEVQRRPQKAPLIRRSLDYYLPVVLKMLDSYIHMEEQKIQGESMLATMQKIENIMDTVNQAFRNQLDRLYKDEAMDISTDITVLQGMLSQEGLLTESLRPEAELAERRDAR